MIRIKKEWIYLSLFLFLFLLVIPLSKSQPIITINSPTNQTYPNGTAPLDISVSENANLTVELNGINGTLMEYVNSYISNVYGDSSVDMNVYAENENGTDTKELVFTVLDGSASINISDCGNLASANEVYYLTTNITDSSNSTCISVQANNITLNCQGYEIDGVDTGTYGVYINSRYNTIFNCIVSDWEYSIYVELYNPTNYINDSILYSSYHCFRSRSSNIYLNNITSYGCMYEGAFFEGSSNYLTNSIMRDNGYGARFCGGNNQIYNNVFKDNTYHQIMLFQAYDPSYIYNNMFNGTTYFSWDPLINNYLNTTKQNGTRIYSNGTEIGGNYWTNSTGNGYSDTCSDSNTDGFCDSSYQVQGQSYLTDYLPLSPLWQPPPYITVTFNYSSVSFGSLNHNTANNSAPNQADGIYNVTIDTNKNYSVKTYGTNFTGSGYLFSISNLRMDVNQTASDLSLPNSISLSESYQYIDQNISQSITDNYHGFWLSINQNQYATSYTSTVTITYENV